MDPILEQRLKKIKNILIVLSGKGGVGKSSVSLQIALSLLSLPPPSFSPSSSSSTPLHSTSIDPTDSTPDQTSTSSPANGNGTHKDDKRKSARVGILDIDLTGPSLPRMLGLSLTSSETSPLEGDSLEEGVPQGSVLQSTDGWVPITLPFPNQGELKAMSLGFLLPSSSTSVVWRGPKKTSMIRSFFTSVSWGELDWLVIDTPPGTGDEHIALLELLSPLLTPSTSPVKTTLSTIMVSTPQALSILDVSKELSFTRRTNLPLLGLIENLAGYQCPHCDEIIPIFGTGGAESWSLKEGLRFLGRLPVDRSLVEVLERGIKGKEDMEKWEKTGSAKRVKEIAEKVRDLVVEL